MIKPVSNWRQVHKHISTLCMGAFMTSLTVFNLLPSAIQSALSATDMKIAAYVMIGLGLVGKYVDQGLKDENSTHD